MFPFFSFNEESIYYPGNLYRLIWQPFHNFLACRISSRRRSVSTKIWTDAVGYFTPHLKLASQTSTIWDFIREMQSRFHQEQVCSRTLHRTSTKTTGEESQRWNMQRSSKVVLQNYLGQQKPAVPNKWYSSETPSASLSWGKKSEASSLWRSCYARSHISGILNDGSFPGNSSYLPHELMMNTDSLAIKWLCFY